MCLCSAECISCSVEIVGAKQHVFTEWSQIRYIQLQLVSIPATPGTCDQRSSSGPSLQDLSLYLSLLYPSKAITIPALLGPCRLLAVGLLALCGFILEVTSWI